LGHCGFAASCSDMVSVRPNVFPHFSQRYGYVGMTQEPHSRCIANSASDHLAEDQLHFVEREGAQRLGADIAARGDTQRKRGRGLVVRPLADRNDVVLTERPIKVFDGDAALLSHLLEGLRPADGLLNVADALISIMTSAPGSTGNGGDVL